MGLFFVYTGAKRNEYVYSWRNHRPSPAADHPNSGTWTGAGGPRHHRRSPDRCKASGSLRAGGADYHLPLLGHVCRLFPHPGPCSAPALSVRQNKHFISKPVSHMTKTNTAKRGLAVSLNSLSSFHFPSSPDGSGYPVPIFDRPAPRSAPG